MSVEITGLQAVLQKLKHLGDEVSQSAATQATAAMASVVRDAAQERAYVAPQAYQVMVNGVLTTFAPKSVGNAIIIKRLPENERHGLASVHKVTLRGAPKKFGNLLEFSRNTATGRPMPFMRPAYDSQKTAAEVLGRQILEQHIQKAWRDGD